MPGPATQSLGLRLLAVLALVLANAFFVAAEFALVAARRTRIEALVRRGDRKARTVQAALQDLYRQLSAAQLGITVASILLGYVAEDTVAQLFRDWFAALPPALEFLARGDPHAGGAEPAARQARCRRRPAAAGRLRVQRENRPRSHDTAHRDGGPAGGPDARGSRRSGGRCRSIALSRVRGVARRYPRHRAREGHPRRPPLGEGRQPARGAPPRRVRSGDARGRRRARRHE